MSYIHKHCLTLNLFLYLAVEKNSRISSPNIKTNHNSREGEIIYDQNPPPIDLLYQDDFETLCSQHLISDKLINLERLLADSTPALSEERLDKKINASGVVRSHVLNLQLSELKELRTRKTEVPNQISFLFNLT